MGLCFNILWMILYKSLLRFYHLTLLSVLLLTVYLEQIVQLPIHLEVGPARVQPLERRGGGKVGGEQSGGYKSAVLHVILHATACCFTQAQVTKGYCVSLVKWIT